MPLEVERKFLLSSQKTINFIPHDAKQSLIEQAYILSGSQGNLRVRYIHSPHSNQKLFFLTCKGPKTYGRAEEIEFPISQERYTTLLSSCIGRIIRKTRFILSINSHTVEIDFFHDCLAPLCIAEIEGPACSQFEPPAWFGREVTGDPRYDNAALALTPDLPPLF